MNHPLAGRSQHGLEILVCEREKEAEWVIIRRSGQQILGLIGSRSQSWGRFRELGVGEGSRSK